ncbi:protein tamozhennic isoform X2 [Ctenocephalides felis]|nr:protein tamozhennic isoform X2 [Ctenocephalides felis]
MISFLYSSEDIMNKMLDMEAPHRILDWGTKDHLRDLQQQIDQMHFSYLETDDCPQKIEQRQKLEGFIREFLCIVPHSRKFVLRETLQVLHKSAGLQNFSGYRAALAWNAIARYAANLLTQPWRKEYKEIKLYCGFYKHEIEENLVGAEIIFEAMGYKRVDGSTLLLEGPICPDQVAHVSRDSLVAFVECEILKNIWETVSAVCNIKWLEALQFREVHIGGPEQASKALLYRHNENNYQQCKPENNCNSYAAVNDVQYQHYSHLYNRNMSNVMTSDLPGQCLYGQFVPQNPYGLNCYGHPPAYAITIPVNIANAVPIPFQNGMPNYMMPNYINPTAKNFVRYGYNNEAVSQNLNDYTGQAHVATGQLIEVDGGQNMMPQLSQQSYKYDEVDSNSYKSNLPQQFTNKVEKINNNKDCLKTDESFETWDYVYRDLEKQGYSKDLGDRENVLEKKMQNNSSSNITKLEYSLQSLNLQKPSKDNEVIVTNKINNNKSKTEVYKKNKASNKSSEKLEISKPLSKKSEFWQCITCTFNNSIGKDICEMCGKSRKGGSEIQPLTSGGKECSKCTLVNEKDTKICVACGASLLDSPTYI